MIGKNGKFQALKPKGKEKIEPPNYKLAKLQGFVWETTGGWMPGQNTFFP